MADPKTAVPRSPRPDAGGDEDRQSALNGTDRPDGTPAEKSGGGLRSLVEWIVILVGALLIASIVRIFLFGAYYIPSGSMEPTLNINDRVLVNKLSYKLHDINRGDVVVFKRPDGAGSGAIKDLIKRVVAVENDTVQLDAGRLVVNGKTVDEPYVHGLPTQPLSLFSTCPPADGRPNTCKVPANQILVMGDNRTNSADGRVFGPIGENLVVGRAFVQIWPLGDISTL